MTSFKIKIDKQRRTYVRLIGQVRNELSKALSEEAVARKLTKSQIARTLGRDRSVVGKLLTGQANMTLESLADLAYAMDRSVEVKLISHEKLQAGINTPVQAAQLKQLRTPSTVVPFSTTIQTVVN